LLNTGAWLWLDKFDARVRISIRGYDRPSRSLIDYDADIWSRGMAEKERHADGRPNAEAEQKANRPETKPEKFPRHPLELISQIPKCNPSGCDLLLGPKMTGRRRAISSPATLNRSNPPPYHDHSGSNGEWSGSLYVAT